MAATKEFFLNMSDIKGLYCGQFLLQFCVCVCVFVCMHMCIIQLND